MIRSLTFSLSFGQTLAVTGPSGSGKSTLLRALSGLVPIREGRVELEEQDAEALGIHQWRAEVSLVPQDPPFLTGSFSDFVERVANLAVQRSRGTTDTLSQETARYMAELGAARELLDSPFAHLSGGERQRLYLSLVLATKPQVLLLDEPTSALDDHAKSQVEELLRGRTCLWVTHDIGQAQRIADGCVELGS